MAFGYYFLFIESKEDIDYHGVDIITDFIKANKLKYPHGKFSPITETEVIKKIMISYFHQEFLI